MKQTTTILILVMLGTSSVPGAESVSPEGDQFPLCLYSIHSVEGMTSVKRFGWNVAHTYGFKPAFLHTCAKGGMLALAHLPGESELIPEAEAARTIKELAASDSVAWWDLPEERRWWREKEMALIANYCKWTRRYDRKQRPNYMYIPGHYTTEDVVKYVPHLDIVPASLYTTYSEMPHAWVRWRMEATVKAIGVAGYTIGNDYLNGQKTPVAVLELFYGGERDKPVKIMSPEGAYHDFWQCIVSGARGILLFSYWHKRDKPQYERNWQAYNRAASQITGKERLGRMILDGRELDTLGCEVTKGPERTEEFVPHGTNLKSLSFPSIDFLAKVWNRHLYVILVNSAEKPVSARITGLPSDVAKAVVLFEDRTVPTKEASVEMSFGPLGVHILKMSLGTGNASRSDEARRSSSLAR